MNLNKNLYKNEVRVNTPGGVNRLLQRVINALLKGEIKENRARTIGYLCNIILKGIEVNELANRIETLEDILSNKEKAG